VQHRLLHQLWSEAHLNENDGQRDDALNDELEDEIDFELDDELDLEDRVGSIEQSHNGNEIVLSWSRRGANEGTEMLRFDQDANLLRIFPKVRRGVTYHNPFDQLTELQVEAPDWNPKQPLGGKRSVRPPPRRRPS
jgi:hypothetical protein